MKRRAGGRPRAGPRDHGPGGAAGRAEAQGRGESDAEQLRPGASGAAGGGRGAPIGARASAGAAVWTLKGPGRPALRRGARTRVVGAVPRSPLCLSRRPPTRTPCSYSSSLTPAHPPAPSTPCAGKFVPESNLDALQLHHGGGARVGGCLEIGKLGAPGPQLAAEKTSTCSPRAILRGGTEPRTPASLATPILWPGLLTWG